jgi:hypothetical protein
MSDDINKKLDDALGIDIDKVMKDIDDDLATNEDQAIIKKHEERKEQIDQVKAHLKDARSMKNKDWAQALLKKSAETIMVTQEVFAKEIEDNPASKNITALGELSNALVSTVSEVNSLDHEEEKIAISKDKNNIRRAELDGGSIDAPTNREGIVAIGTGSDILNLLDGGVDPTEESNA